MMPKEVKNKIENNFEVKEIKTFLNVLSKLANKKVGIPDLRAYIQDIGAEKDKTK